MGSIGDMVFEIKLKAKFDDSDIRAVEKELQSFISRYDGKELLDAKVLDTNRASGDLKELRNLLDGISKNTPNLNWKGLFNTLDKAETKIKEIEKISSGKNSMGDMGLNEVLDSLEKVNKAITRLKVSMSSLNISAIGAGNGIKGMAQDSITSIDRLIQQLRELNNLMSTINSANFNVNTKVDTQKNQNVTKPTEMDVDTEGALAKIRTFYNQTRLMFNALRMQINNTFSFNGIQPNYAKIQDITDNIFRQFVALQGKINSLDFTIVANTKVKNNTTQQASGDTPEISAYEKLIKLQDEYFKRNKAFTFSTGNEAKQLDLLNKTIEALERYKKARREALKSGKLTIGQDDDLIKRSERLQKEIDAEVELQRQQKQKAAQWKAISAEYEKYYSLMKEIQNMRTDQSGNDYTRQIAAALKEQAKAKANLKAMGVELTSVDKSNLLTQEQINSLLKIRSKYINDIYKQSLKQADAKAGTVKKSSQSTYTSELKALNQIESKLRSMSNYKTDSILGTKAQEYRQAVKELQTAMKQLWSNPGDEKLQQGFQDAALKAREAGKAVSDMIKQVDKLRSKSLGNKIGEAVVDTSAVSSVEKMKAAMEDFAASATNGQFRLTGWNSAMTEMYGTVTRASGAVEEITVAMNKANNTMQAYHTTTSRSNDQWTNFKSSVGGSLKGIVAMYASFYDIVRYVRNGIQDVRDLDLAMTELKKVTDETSSTYSTFLKTASSTSREIGSTITDFTTATADFARLGYSIGEASDLAKTALLYKNVGDGFNNVSEASESIISTMMAFGDQIQEPMDIIDKFNEVGNNFAISSKGLGDALQRSASALMEGGNSLDEAIGLTTGAM